MKGTPASLGIYYADGHHPPVFVSFDQLPLFGVPPYSRVHMYRLMRKNLFPQQVQITPNRVGWTLDSVLAWVASRPLSSKVVPEAADGAAD
jgi:Prophage CP4-57 regulatory protein (AlpA)